MRHLISWIFIVSILLFGCSTAKELLDKAEKKDPAIVAEYARQKYPCTDLLKPDTLVTIKDSLVFVDVECPDSITKETVIKTDTLNNVITKTIRVPVNMPIQIRTITKWYEDSAKLKLAAISINNLQQDTANYRKQIVKLDGKVATRNKWLLWLLIVVICETLWILRKPIIKLFTAFL